jgi:hypothetical protein
VLGAILMKAFVADNARSRRVIVHQTSTWPPSTIMTWPVLKPCCIK